MKVKVTQQAMSHVVCPALTHSHSSHRHYQHMHAHSTPNTTHTRTPTDTPTHLQVSPQLPCLLVQHLNGRLPPLWRHNQRNPRLGSLGCNATEVCKGVLPLLCCGVEGGRGRKGVVVAALLWPRTCCWAGGKGRVVAVLAAGLCDAVAVRVW